MIDVKFDLIQSQMLKYDENKNPESLNDPNRLLKSSPGFRMVNFRIKKSKPFLSEAPC